MKRAARAAAESGAVVLITLRCVEYAARILKASDLKIYRVQSISAAKNIELYKRGKLDILTRFDSGYDISG